MCWENHLGTSVNLGLVIGLGKHVQDYQIGWETIAGRTLILGNTFSSYCLSRMYSLLEAMANSLSIDAMVLVSSDADRPLWQYMRVHLQSPTAGH